MVMTKASKLQRLRSKLGKLKEQGSSKGGMSTAEGFDAGVEGPPKEVLESTGRRLQLVNWGRTAPEPKVSATTAEVRTVGDRLSQINWERKKGFNSPSLNAGQSGSSTSETSSQALTVDGFFADVEW